MKLAAIVGLSAFLFGVATFYCFRRGNISGRVGAFYLVVGSVACASLLVSVLSIESALFMRDWARSARFPSADLVPHAAGDPSGAQLVNEQSQMFSKPDRSDIEAWRSWQERLREHLIVEVYELDFDEKAEWKPGAGLVRESLDGEGLVRKEFVIPAVDGDSIQGVLLLPAGVEDRLPVIVVLHGHVRDGESGLAQMVLPWSSYQNSAARELALAGFATFTIELRGFGMRGPPTFPDHHIVAYNALLSGGFYKKLVFDDIKRTVDFVEALPEVNPNRIGISGVSLGAELAVEYAGLDERIKVISFHSHGGHTGPYPGRSAPSELPHYCHVVPGVNRLMHREDPFLLLAPRPTQGVRGERDGFRYPAFVQGLQSLWALMRRSDALEIETVANEGHAYFVEPALHFFRKHL